MATEIDRLRAVLSAMTPRPWQPEHPRAEEPGGWVISRAGAVAADVFRGAGPEDTRGIVALANVASELLAAVRAFDRIAWMAEKYAEAGGSHGPEVREFRDAMQIRAALDARIREALEPVR